MIKVISNFARIIFFVPLLSMAEISKELSSLPIPLMGGDVVNLDKYKGVKPVYLKFWATWCQPCMREMPHFQEMQKRYGDSVEIISINLGINDTEEDVNKVISKFGLTMPTVIDESGELAQAFKFVGSPYHLLLDRNMNLVHRGHKASESLDNKLALLSNKKAINPISPTVLNEMESELVIPNLNTGSSGIFFTATWCDWYLKDTKPKASENCSRSQEEFNKLVKIYPSVNWVLVVSRLWTAESDLVKYSEKYKIPVSGFIDVSNKMFMNYAINTFPTLVFLNNGVEKYRTTELKSDGEIVAFIKMP